MKFCAFMNMVLLITLAPCCAGVTDPRDVEVISRLYVSLGQPPLVGWAVGGDPCGEKWQGVACVFSNITAIDLEGQNLEGNLGEGLDFVSVMTMDLSNNRISGSIPSVLPPTVTNLTLSNNTLTGVIPDSFLQLGNLVNLDLSDNNLTGQLPLSFGNLPSLSTLHLQNNHLTGMLDVLQDLHLVDLNIENNQFSGPIPGKLLAIPNFRKDGNPFNTTVILPPLAAPVPSPAEAPSPGGASRKSGLGPSASEAPIPLEYEKKSKSNDNIFWIIGVCVLLVIIMAFGMLLYFSRCSQGKQVNGLDAKLNPSWCKGNKKEPKYNESLLHPGTMEKGQREAVVKPLAGFGVENRSLGLPPRLWDMEKKDDMSGTAIPRHENRRAASLSHGKNTVSSSNHGDHEVNLTGTQTPFAPLGPLPPPPSLYPLKQGTVNTSRAVKSTTFFTIATLQQYTNSFSQSNFIGKGMFGSVYRAELPGGKLLAVKKLHNAISKQLYNGQFLELVSSISKLQHDNVVDFVGYSAEHGQCLLVYDYCENGTLYDALHVDKEMHKSLSWQARVRMALGIARALEYLHEVCQPPILHKNFKSANILLGNELVACVSDCGLAPLLSYCSSQQMSGHLTSLDYGAPEIESGDFSTRSDVYSFGVVMLELLTGRKSFDRSRPRGEQSLVRWAVPRLHDIDALSKMVDPVLKGMCSMKSLSRFADVISLCVQGEPEFRPPMSLIVQELLQLVRQEP